MVGFFQNLGCLRDDCDRDPKQDPIPRICLGKFVNHLPSSGFASWMLRHVTSKRKLPVQILEL